ncbi:MAG: hypothetical protein LBQ12_00145 [Deltaproteobacteria bacterium]|nr:hypothetical protein [Deltaproteobacteria bacterium]
MIPSTTEAARSAVMTPSTTEAARPAVAPPAASPAAPPPATRAVLAVAVAVAVALALPVIAAAPRAAAQEDPAWFYRGQRPMTPDDVPAALELAAFHFGALTEWELTQTAGRLFVDEARLLFLTAKIKAGLRLLGPDPPSADQLAEESGTKLALPTPAELEVIRGMEGRLREAVASGGSPPDPPAKP